MIEYLDRSQITLENIDKKLEFENDFENSIGGIHRTILYTSPEVLFMSYICHGETDKAVALFEDTKLFNGEKSAIDAPMGRYEGLQDIRFFAEGWLDFVLAEHAWITPLVQTRSGGRSVTEMVVNFKIREREKILKIPMAVVADIRPHNMIEELRIYFYWNWMPGLIPYRPRQWKPQHQTEADHNQLLGAVKQYFSKLMDPDLPFDDWKKVISPRFRSGGNYRPSNDPMAPTPAVVADAAGLPGNEAFAKIFKDSLGVMPFWNVLRIIHSIDDGITGCMEWISLPQPQDYALEHGYKPYVDWDARSWQSGFSAYERDEDGLLVSVRICDYYGTEYGMELKDIPFRW